MTVRQVRARLIDVRLGGDWRKFPVGASAEADEAEAVVVVVTRDKRRRWVAERREAGRRGEAGPGPRRSVEAVRSSSYARSGVERRRPQEREGKRLRGRGGGGGGGFYQGCVRRQIAR